MLGVPQELLLVELDEPCSLEELGSLLERHLPDDIRILRVFNAPSERWPVPQWVQYRVSLSHCIDRTVLTERIREFQQASQWPVQRSARRRHPARTIDLRAYVLELKLQDDTLLFTVSVTSQATPRIQEILELLGIDNGGLVEWICRMGTGYSPEWMLGN